MFQLYLAAGAADDLRAWSGLEDAYELARDLIVGDVADVERRIVLEAACTLGEESAE
jgi:hypothetical protein